MQSDILWRVLDIFFRRNNETRAHIAMWARASLFRRFTDTNVHGTGSVKIRKLATKYPTALDIRTNIFLSTVQCINLRVVAEFKLGLATDIAALARVLDDAGDTVDRLGALVGVARLAVLSRRLVLRPVARRITLVVLRHRLTVHRTYQKAGDDRRQRHESLPHCSTDVHHRLDCASCPDTTH